MMKRLVLVLFAAFAISGSSYAQCEAESAFINEHAKQHFSSFFSWNIPEMSITDSDSITFRNPLAVDWKLTLNLQDIKCVNQLKLGNVYQLYFYYQPEGKDMAQYPMYIYSDHDTLVQLIEAFHDVYRCLNIDIPPLSCAAYENDRVAQMLAIRWIRPRPNYPNSYLMGVDSMVSGKVVHTYLNGRVRMERNLVDGLLDGMQYDYFENGTLSFQGKFSNGIPLGEHFDYYQTGVVSRVERFKDGLQHGVQEMYWENGVVNIRQYIENVILKKEEAFNEDGSPQE